MSTAQKHGGISEEKTGPMPVEPSTGGFEKFQARDFSAVNAHAPGKVSRNAGGNPHRGPGTKTGSDLGMRRKLSTAGQ
jgi:hypothetical protein